MATTSRVLHVIAPAPFGGLERVVETLTLAQASSGRPVGLVAILDPGAGEPPFLTGLRGAVDVIPLVVEPRAYRREQVLLSETFGAWKPDVIHTHGARSDVLARGPARRHRAALVSTTHGFTGGGIKNRFFEWLQCRSLGHFDAVVAVAAPLRQRLLGAGIPADRIHDVPNSWSGQGTTLLGRAESRGALALGANEFVLGWVGRLSREKGLDVTLEALALLPKGTRPTLVVVGAGREESHLQALAGSLGVSEQVRWAGGMRGAGHLFRAFDLFVMSSRTEGTPMVLFEAMAARVPIIATRVGGIPDVVGPAEAMLIPSEQPAALAEAIATARADAAAATRRAEAALTRLGEFDETRARERYDQVYESAIALAALRNSRRNRS